MNISDIRTKMDAQNERSRLVTRGADRSIEPDETVLTLVDHAERNEPESSIMTDPLIQALVDKLPPPNSIWSIDDRANWLEVLAMITIWSTGPRKVKLRSRSRKLRSQTRFPCIECGELI